MQNDGNVLELHLKDDRIGSIGVALPPHVSATVTRTPKVIRFTLSKPITVLLTGLKDTYGIASNQRLQYVELTASAVEYGFESASLHDRLTLIINLSKEVSKPDNQPAHSAH